MRLDMIDDKYIIYLKKIYDINEDSVKDYLKKLEEYYHLNFNGLYIANAYIDFKYGTILELIKEDYVYNLLNIHIIKYNCEFLYLIDDILDIKYKDFYIYKNKYYVTELLEKEFVQIVYKDTIDIINNGKYINVNKKN